VSKQRIRTHLITRTVVIGVALAALCAVTATPASATVPGGWEATALGVPAAQQLSQGAGVTVAVLDSGVMTNHPDLKGKVTTGPDYLGDGRKPGDPKWGGHGTAMASDVLKVAPKAHILSVRVIDDRTHKKIGASGGKTAKVDASPISKGVEYAVTHGANLITMSVGREQGIFSYDQAEADALAYAANHGVPVLASAGNDGDALNEVSYPAAYATVIAVAATQQNGSRAAFSTARTYNEVAAPGVGITSASNIGGLVKVNGTSPACALAAGVVALMLSRNDKLTPAQVRTILTSTALHPQGGHNAQVGYGKIDAPAAVKAASSPPAAKTAALPYTGKEHLANPDGTLPVKHPEKEPILWFGGLGTAGVGLVMMIACVSLALRRRSSRGLSPGGMRV
jgi:subtilisin family serine protease